MAVASDKGKTLDSAILQIQKQFGKGSIMRMGIDVVEPIPAIPTGALSLDIATGVGGIPRGRVTEIYGPESSGKTTLALHVIAEAQKRGGTAAFIDAEHALDITYAERLGVNIDDLLVSQPDFGEQALEIAEILIRSGSVDVIVVDSVAALVPKAEIDGNIGDSHVGLQARLMSQTMRKMTGILNRSHTALVFINQIRMKIGVMYGNPETTTGGNALKFYSSLRIDIRKLATIKDGAEVIGNRTRVKIVKNKVAPPFKIVEFDIVYGEGISKTGDLLDMAVTQDIVEKSGSWYSFNGERIGQGRENSKAYLKDHPEIMTDIEEKVRLGFGLGAVKLAAISDDDSIDD
ncbi:MAG: recombinase RecA [Proteobacteria bacterium]|nr:recombinase RecA [Pseudomonadota bacterium]MBU1686267.1 recombinase RecA [Pseudomonadota bacterium]